ncbi:membrane protein [Sulfurifustis variabilis]|uniref:Membrane protein n=1 Tax=Sulfurifustis variabilis TaxID=1675686 RepID=A0A1B4V7R5_9GAMM|nr:hypothetical protein [Sulfurifustis variabilis]BAU49566.1 membrane protein [Sulfurifustis variabilis]
MHGYASDNFFRGPKVYFAFGALAIGAASALRAMVVLPPMAGHVDAAALSAGAIYAALIFLYERWGWRWLSTLKNLNGTWAGEITSSHNGGARVPCVMRVRQRWTRMAIELETEQSRSRTTMAALYEEQPGDIGLKYEYVCEPRNLAAQTMQTHRGVCTMAIAEGTDGLRLSGDYFTGRGRETRGEVTLHRISRDFLGFGAALKREN